MYSSLAATCARQITIPLLKFGSVFNIIIVSMLKIFSCAICLHYSHICNKAIPHPQGFQSAHNSEK